MTGASGSTEPTDAWRAPDAAGHAALIWDSAYQRYRFSDDHPSNPLRLELTVDLMRATGLLEAAPGTPPLVLPPRPASRDELNLAHDPAFIDAVARLSAPGARCDDPRWGLGTVDMPIFPGMHDAAALTAGGTLLAAELVMRGDYRHVFNLAGGHHHAQRALASGFGIYNDAAIAIEWLTRQHRARVLYIDNDAHHGDGVEFAFAGRDDVLTVSLHESGRFLFPGTGFVEDLGFGRGRGYSVNLPLEPFTDDASWLASFDALVPALAAAFQPDVIVLQSGVDGHARDPLTHLRATTNMLETVARRVHGLAHDLCDGRLVVLGGGGYDIWSVVPRAWTLVWSVLSGQPTPPQTPPAWRARWQSASPVPLPLHLRDDPADYPSLDRQPRISAANAATLRRLCDLLAWAGMDSPPGDWRAGW
ncbi:MAG: acetoin utilization protein AcuC [Chloroflexi bacterium]|nr:acetoin utilization protein AcuC [Chloroflexota bacterium]